MTEHARFEIVAATDPQTLPRLVNYLAQLGLVPSRVTAVSEAGAMRVTIEQDALPERQARIVAERMQTSVLVEHVALECD